jgi:hypothetical protein
MNNCDTGICCLSLSNAFQFYKFYEDRKKDLNLIKFQILMELRELFELKNEQLNKMNEEKKEEQEKEGEEGEEGGESVVFYECKNILNV